MAEEGREGSGCFTTGVIVFLVLIVVVFGLLVGMCGLGR